VETYVETCYFSYLFTQIGGNNRLFTGHCTYYNISTCMHNERECAQAGVCTGASFDGYFPKLLETFVRSLDFAKGYLSFTITPFGPTPDGNSIFNLKF
jgi:hypothetical protein